VVERSDRISTFPRPDKPITLYEFEGCPFCRKVRPLLRARMPQLYSGSRPWQMHASQGHVMDASVRVGIAPLRTRIWSVGGSWLAC